MTINNNANNNNNTTSNNEEEELTITFENDLTEVLSEELKTGKYSVCETVKYVDYITRSNNFVPLEVSWKDLDKFDFTNKSFFEVLASPTYVHLYFDFDEITTEEEFVDVLDWMDKVSTVFGQYSYGGYSNNEQLAKEVGLRYIANDKHFVSMHVIYYQTKIDASDMQKLMKHTKKDGYKYEGVHKLCDPNVYKLVARYEGKTTRQLFRHVLSDKIYAPNHEGNKENHGYLVNGTPSQHIVQVHGDEPTINELQWSSLFKLKEKPTTKKNPMYEKTKPTTQQPTTLVTNRNLGDDFIVDPSLIMLNEEELLELLSEIEPEYDNLITILPILYHSPYKLSTLSKVLKE